MSWAVEQQKIFYMALAKYGDNPGVVGMAKTISDVTEFMHTEVEDMNMQASELHAQAVMLKTKFDAAAAAAKEKLAKAEQEVMDLQASLGST